MEELQQTGLSQVGALAERFGVSEMTIRRDLDVIGRTSDVVRVHGGAMLRGHGTSFEPLWDAKVALRNEAKARIGKAGAALVRPGETVLLDSGTTSRAIALALAVPCSVVSVDVKIALALASRPVSAGIETLLVGGSVRRGYYSTTGQFALDMLEQLHVDRAFLGADAIEIDAGITNATVDEAAVKRRIIAAANEVVLVADATKFGTVSLAHVAPLSAVDLWITDDDLASAAVEQLRSMGLSLQVV